MDVSRNKECPQNNIFVNGNQLRQRDQFKYSGSLISSYGCNDTEIPPGIA